MKEFRSIYCRIRVILALKFVSGESFIKIVLKRIELKKKALIIFLDGNQPVFLDRDLSQVDLPASFSFYNFVMNMILEKFPTKRKLYFKL